MTLKEYFEKNRWINVTELARIIGINDALLRQYVSGVKVPSEDQTRIIIDRVEDLVYISFRSCEDVSGWRPRRKKIIIDYK